MPQMAPMNWLLLYFIFMLIFIIIIILNYYSYTPTNLETKLYTNKKIIFNWKW